VGSVFAATENTLVETSALFFFSVCVEVAVLTCSVIPMRFEWWLKCDPSAQIVGVHMIETLRN